jgi:ABC-type multidrug transport system fused ATPase/permease subunit
MPTAGSLRVDGLDLRALSLADLRRDAVLVRDVELFPGTVLENVRLGRDELPHERIVEALEAVGVLDELLALPQGLDTPLHPHGRPLSRRQACRLMIARAIVGTPRLIVVDGVLDILDPQAGREALAEMLFAPDAPWTLLCITERPDLLARCTSVVRFDDGMLTPVPTPGVGR